MYLWPSTSRGNKQNIFEMLMALQCKSLQASLYFSCLITLDYFLFTVSASNAYVSLVQR